MQLKVIAVIDAARHGTWSVMVEMDRYTVERLRGGSLYECPKPGTEIDLSDAAKRLLALEERERSMKAFGEIIAKFLPEPPKNEPTPLPT